MIKTTRLLALAALASAVAVPAFAGPVGSGLGHTEGVARKAHEQRTVRVAAQTRACAAVAEANLKAAHADASVNRSGDYVSVTFNTAEDASKRHADVRATVASACA